MPLRQKLYGVLLQENESNNWQVEELTITIEKTVKKVFVEAIRPGGELFKINMHLSMKI